MNSRVLGTREWTSLLGDTILLGTKARRRAPPSCHPPLGSHASCPLSPGRLLHLHLLCVLCQADRPAVWYFLAWSPHLHFPLQLTVSSPRRTLATSGADTERASARLCRAPPPRTPRDRGCLVGALRSVTHGGAEAHSDFRVTAARSC